MLLTQIPHSVLQFVAVCCSGHARIPPEEMAAVECYSVYQLLMKVCLLLSQIPHSECVYPAVTLNACLLLHVCCNSECVYAVVTYAQ